ncbi:hypothetical protein F2A38_30270 [Pseudomonas chlororaphis]|uniref:Uncharacterized protein n=1 Tax=Pseudomonas chlororaphis TaxID=587753 RepID=A0AB34BVQ1_9PSED|nr:hypothetical protein F2A38_30270 [Pseudomonas chlororaphis]
MKTTAGFARNTALKTGSECSFTASKVGCDSNRSSPVFALSCLRSLRFHGVWSNKEFCKNLTPTEDFR